MRVDSATIVFAIKDEYSTVLNASEGGAKLHFLKNPVLNMQIKMMPATVIQIETKRLFNCLRTTPKSVSKGCILKRVRAVRLELLVVEITEKMKRTVNNIKKNSK